MTKITIAPSARTKRALTELAAAGDNPTLDAATVDALKRHAEAIKLLVRRASRDIIEIGHRLIKAQELAGHGNWLRWLDQEFDWSEQTARHYMRVYELSSIHNVIVDLEKSRWERPAANAWASTGVAPKISDRRRTQYARAKFLPFSNPNYPYFKVLLGGRAMGALR